MKTLRNIAAMLLCFTGFMQINIFSHDLQLMQNILIGSIGVIFVILGIMLYYERKIAYYLGAFLPFIGILPIIDPLLCTTSIIGSLFAITYLIIALICLYLIHKHEGGVFHYGI